LSGTSGTGVFLDGTGIGGGLSGGFFGLQIFTCCLHALELNRHLMHILHTHTVGPKSVLS